MDLRQTSIKLVVYGSVTSLIAYNATSSEIFVNKDTTSKLISISLVSIEVSFIISTKELKSLTKELV